jgi:hypothetical protein
MADIRRMYAFSDTYGRSKNPFLQDDADAILSTHFRSFPLESHRRYFDIYGREAITAHLLRLIFALHDELEASPYLSKDVKAEFAKTATGIFINAAPRVSKENGAPFYVATAEGIRIVTTDLNALSTVKHRIQTIAHLPNENNNLYGRHEQFRSSYTPYLLHDDHGLKLDKDTLDVIPDYPEDKWELAYVDRFGNMLTYTKNVDARWSEVSEASQSLGGYVKLIIGNVSQRTQIGSSLDAAEPGGLVMYQNGDIEVLRKWRPNEDSYTRLYKSAFFQFNKPEIGSRVRLAKPTLYEDTDAMDAIDIIDDEQGM